MPVSTGLIAIRPPVGSAFRSHEASIIGNTCLYGATGGRLKKVHMSNNIRIEEDLTKPGVAEFLLRAACGIQTTSGRAIQAGVADNACFMAAEG